MTKKTTPALQALEAIGPDMLAGLVFNEASNKKAFKRRGAAALSGQSGPGTVVKLIDRRLSGPND